MNLDEIKQKAWKFKGATNYWKDIRSIKDDLSLLNPLAKRLKTCPFPIEVRIANRAFDTIFKDWCYNLNYVEDAYAVYVMLNEIILCVYNDTDKYTDKEKHDFLEWCYNSGIDVCEFVRYTIDCSRGIAEIISEIDKIMREIEMEKERKQ